MDRQVFDELEIISFLTFHNNNVFENLLRAQKCVCTYIPRVHLFILVQSPKYPLILKKKIVPKHTLRAPTIENLHTKIHYRKITDEYFFFLHSNQKQHSYSRFKFCTIVHIDILKHDDVTLL